MPYLKNKCQIAPTVSTNEIPKVGAVLEEEEAEEEDAEEELDELKAIGMKQSLHAK